MTALIAVLLVVAADGGADARLEAIRERYRETERATLTRSEVPLDGCGGEGGAMLVFRSGEVVRKVVLTRYGEMGRTETQLYFNDGRVEFVYVQATRYESTFGKVSSVAEDRFYFDGDELFAWVTGAARTAVPGKRLAARGKQLLAQAKAVLAAAGKPSAACDAVMPER